MEVKSEDYLVAAEYQVLRAIIEDPSCLDNPLDPDLFPHKSARDVYKALESLWKNGETINEQSLLREAGELNSSISAITIRSIWNTKADLSNLKPSIEVLEKGSVKHRINTKLAKIQELTSLPDDIDDSVLSGLIYEMQTIVRNGGDKKKAKTFEDIAETYKEELLHRKDGKYHLFNDFFLDKYLTRKASPGQVVVIGASTGAGKSAYGLNLINGMVNLGTPCMYFSLEMDEISTMDRWLALRTGVPVEEWYSSGPIMDKLIDKVSVEQKALVGKKFQFVDDPYITIDNITHLIQEFKSIYQVDYTCVFIDLVTMVKEFSSLDRGSSLANQIEFSINRLNAIAKSENVCFVCIVQMNRETDKEKVESIEDLDKYRPTLSQIKNSNALGERARVVLSVFRPKYYAERLFPDDPTTKEMSDVMQIQVLKQSQGSVGMVGKYQFDGPVFKIMPLVEKGEEDDDTE